MERSWILRAAAALCAGCSFTAVAQTLPEYQGLVSAVRLERTASGHLTEINGKYKLRASETYIEPGGFIGEHQHVGPGIRYVLAGELTFIEEGRVQVFRAGDYFYEAGDVTHRGENRGTSKVTLLQFEIVPVAWSGTGTAYAPPAPR